MATGQRHRDREGYGDQMIMSQLGVGDFLCLPRHDLAWQSVWHAIFVAGIGFQIHCCSCSCFCIVVISGYR